VQIIVNGAALEIEAGLSLGALLARTGKSIEHVAVECNGEVVELDANAQLTLQANDQIEIVHFVGGG